MYARLIYVLFQRNSAIVSLNKTSFLPSLATLYKPILTVQIFYACRLKGDWERQTADRIIISVIGSWRNEIPFVEFCVLSVAGCMKSCQGLHTRFRIGACNCLKIKGIFYIRILTQVMAKFPKPLRSRFFRRRGRQSITRTFPTSVKGTL